MRWISRSAVVVAVFLVCGSGFASAQNGSTAGSAAAPLTPAVAQTQAAQTQAAQTQAAPAQAAPTQAPLLAGSIASHPAALPARPEDVRSVDALVAAVYDVISGPPGKSRDWNRFLSLFAPDGRLGVVRPERPAANGQPAAPGDIVFLTPEMYVERDAPLFATTGFFEHAIANRVESFGNLAHVWSTYESRHAEDDKQPFARGINSIQMIQARGRWWIVSLVWDQEREGLTLPDKYLR
jgi:hypothetical protein